MGEEIFEKLKKGLAITSYYVDKMVSNPYNNVYLYLYYHNHLWTLW